MKCLNLFLLFITAHSFGQSKDQQNLNLKIAGIAQEFVFQGTTDFYIIDRDLPGMVYVGKDSCEAKLSVTLVAIPHKDKNSFRVIEFNECGREKDKILPLDALQYFETHKGEISKDDFDQRHYVDHTEFYSFYEFKNKKLSFIKEDFCKECLDIDDRKEGRSNSTSKTYIFFTMLDKELDL